MASACSDDPEKVDIGGDSGPDNSAGSPSPSAAPRVITSASVTFHLPPVGDAQTEAIYTGYQVFWVSLTKAYAKGDPSDRTLYANTTGGARKLFGNNLANMQVSRQTQSGPVQLHPTVAAATASTASVSDCADLSQFRIRDRSGKPVNPPDPKTTQIDLKLVLQAGKWIVQSYDESSRGCTPRT